MSMPQFGSELARDHIDRLIEEAEKGGRVARPRKSRPMGALGRVLRPFRGPGAVRSRRPGRVLRLPR